MAQYMPKGASCVPKGERKKETARQRDSETARQRGTEKRSAISYLPPFGVSIYYVVGNICPKGPRCRSFQTVMCQRALAVFGDALRAYIAIYAPPSGRFFV